MIHFEREFTFCIEGWMDDPVRLTCAEDRTLLHHSYTDILFQWTNSMWDSPKDDKAVAGTCPYVRTGTYTYVSPPSCHVFYSSIRMDTQ